MGRKTKYKSSKNYDHKSKSIVLKMRKILSAFSCNPLEIWNSLFGMVVSLIGGFFIGFSSRSYRESWIYSMTLIILSISCILGSILSKHANKKRIFTDFSSYFLVAGLSSPVAAWISFSII